jgi:universal stress protein A
VRIGPPWREIVAAAQELDIDMIVLGAHGKHGLKALLLGNTVENVTRHASCPVMIIR